MYKILRSDGAVLYDTATQNTRPVTDPKGTFEIGQAGSLQFSLVPDHPLYDGVGVMETFVSALKDNNEIFYGRIIDINTDEITGIKQIECAGALQFLEDGELPPVVGETPEPAEGEEQSQQPQGIELTASQFFARCIAAHNSEIEGDSRRALSVGTISHSKAGSAKVYNIPNYTQVKSAMDTNLIGEYGGYFRVRKSGNTRYVDWLDTYSEPNTSPIQIRENVISQENAISANDLFTMIRPIGKNNLELPPRAISAQLVSKYGRIIRTVNFGEAETATDLGIAADNYIADLAKGAGHTCTVKLVDLHVIHNDIPAIRMGSTYTNISGFEGEPMVVAGMELNFANPADDSITLKNAKELEAKQKGGTSGRGALSKSVSEGSGSKGFQNIWQHITEGEDWLRLAADRIEINAKHLIELAGTFERYSEETREEFQIQNTTIEGIRGTGVLQNSDQITQVAGLFTSKYYLVPESARTGRHPNTAGWFEAHPYVISESDVGSGIELFGSVNQALAGKALNTNTELPGMIGQTVTRMVPSNDSTPVSGKNYYSKTLGLLNGASFSLTEDGLETNVGTLISETSKSVGESKVEISKIEGSALWTKRDHITGVCGEYEIEVDEETGEKTLKIVSGGGLKLVRDGAEFGVYDDGKLTGGVIVDLINDPDNDKSVIGTRVSITASQVTAGSYSTVQAWLEANGEDIDRLDGLVADKATIAQLNALQARIGTLETDAITTNKLSSMDIQTQNISCASLTSERGGINVQTVGAKQFVLGGTAFSNCIASASVSNDGKTLTLKPVYGADITFNKAATAELSGSWSGRNFTVTATPADSAIHNPVVGTVYDGIVPNTSSPVTYNATNKNVSREYLVYSEDEGGDAGSIILRKTVTISASDAWTAGYNAGAPISGTAGGRTPGVTALVHNFTINRADGTPAALQIDVSSIYTAARKGYTLGTFEAVTARKVLGSGGTELYAKSPNPIFARGIGLTCYPTVASGGTLYYTAGTATKYYKASSSTVTARGTKITPTKTTYNAVDGPYTFTYQTLYDNKGKVLGSAYVGSAGASSMYRLGKEYTVYDVGSTYKNGVYAGDGGGYVTQGDEVTVTPISGTGIRLGAAGTYYPGNGGKFYPAAGSAYHLGDAAIYYTKTS